VTDIPDDMKKRLTATVIVTDEGKLNTFRPTDDVPAWARPKITNAKVWGYSRRGGARAARRDFGDGRTGSDGLPELIDVVCSTHAGQPQLVARFEVYDFLGNGDCEWRWTSSLAGRGGPSTDAAGHPVPKERGEWDGQSWSFQPTGEDQGLHHVVQYAPDGRRQVRLRCCGLDLQAGWEKWSDVLNTLRRAEQSSVELAPLVRTMTTKQQGSCGSGLQ
jgi:hypothetical protein